MNDWETTIVKIAPLEWKSDGGSLAKFKADINDDEFFTISYDPGLGVDYRWRLVIHSRSRETNVFLHGHPGLQEAKAAARTHIGDDD